MAYTGIMHAKPAHDVIELLPSTTDTAATNEVGSTIMLPRMDHGIVFLLAMTDKQDAAGDKLDVYVDALITSATGATENWIPIVHFTQQDGNGANAEVYAVKMNGHADVAEFEIGAALAEANHRDIVGDAYRVRYTITDGGGAHSFTFSVQALVY